MSQSQPIDLTEEDPPNDLETDSIDRLTQLPTELLHEIISYLFPAHYVLQYTDPTREDDKDHPLLSFSSTNKFYRRTTNQWCNAWLHQHAAMTKYKDIKDAKVLNARNYITGKFGLLAWTRKHCVFCGKGSVRRAIMVNGLRCCKECDKREWDKITKTKAKLEFNLTDDHLGVGWKGQLPQWPHVRKGSYNGVYGWTTMLVKQDVRRLAWEVQEERRAQEARARDHKERLKEKAAEKRAVAKAARAARPA